MAAEKHYELSGIFFFATLIVLLDSFLLGEQTLTFGLAGLFVLVNIVGTVRHLSRGSQHLVNSLLKAGIYGLMALAAYGIGSWNDGFTEQGLNLLVQANRDYLHKNLHYAEKLEDLVPDYIPAIPWAKYNLSPWNRFTYSNHIITWVSFPMDRMIYWDPPQNDFGKSYYNLETGVRGD